MGLGYPGDRLSISLQGAEIDAQWHSQGPILRRTRLILALADSRHRCCTITAGQDVRTSRSKTPSDQEVADIAASFQEAVVDVLIDKTVLASKIYNVRGITLGGGVAANSRLRQRLQEVSKEIGIPVYCPSPKLCTDNAAMVAGLAYKKYLEGDISLLDVEAIP